MKLSRRTLLQMMPDAQWFRRSSAVGTRNAQTRDEWIETKLAEVPHGSRILDAGAGEQQYKKFCTHLDYVSQDFAQYNPHDLDSGMQMSDWDYGKLDIISDIINIPEPDGSFDVVMCLEVLEHVPDPVRAISELARLVRSGGQIILTAPFCSLTHFAPYHYSTGFGRFFYEKHLPASGFVITELSPNGNYFEYLAQECRRTESVARKYCGLKLGRMENLAFHIVLRTLQRLSQADSGSEELLAFGFHVDARKVS